MAVVEQTIKDGGGYHCIAEHCPPISDGLITGQHQASLLVATIDERETQVGGLALERQIAQLLDYERFGPGE